MNLTTIDLTPRIGTEIKADLETLLNGSAVAKFRCLLEERGIIALREVNLDDRQQVAFAKTLGELTQLGADSIIKVTLDKSRTAPPNIRRLLSSGTPTALLVRF
jgi:alpha-ketoglutarate-dependent taurine dioxygenase